MLMVIFGAGASYDSCPTYPAGEVSKDHRPPLANELFADRDLFVQALDDFPWCKAVVPRLRERSVLLGHRSIETVLEEIQHEARTYPRGKHELAAVRCYLQRAISDCERYWGATTRGVTNYLSLLREIERLRQNDATVHLVTFNYDTILEQALIELGFHFERVEDYSSGSRFFKVSKLHGSVNWGLEIGSQLSAGSPLGVLQSVIEDPDRFKVSDRYVLCPANSMGLFNGRTMFPAIAIPVETKSRFQCPEPMLTELINALPKVTTIITIGWRAAEQHFLALLKEHLRPNVGIYVVAGNRAQAEDVRVHINQALFPNRPNSVAEISGFTQFISSRRAEEILSYY